MAKRVLVTIGREYGSGGHEVGKRLAQKLGVEFYDKELLELASKESGLSRELFEHHDEKPVNSLLYSLSVNPYSINTVAGVPELPITQKLFLAQFHTIQKLAKEKDCVIVGRCADYALQDMPDVVNVFVHAPLDTRIQTVMERTGEKSNQARDSILRTDKKRASYYNSYSNKKWGSLQSYHLSLDSSVLGLDGCVEMILRFLELRK